MSLQFPPKRIARLRHDAQLLVSHTSGHRDDVTALAAAAERDVDRAEAMASDATTGDVYKVRRLLRNHVDRTNACAESFERLRASAGEQHAAACRLLATLDGAPLQPWQPNAVLVVDDYPDIREFLARVLTGAGFAVRTASNGLEGLIAACEMRPGVIVMDVAMPVLDGIEATRLIKAYDATREAQVIAHTGDSPGINRMPSRLFAAVLRKPADLAEIVSTVQRVASASR